MDLDPLVDPSAANQKELFSSFFNFRGYFQLPRKFTSGFLFFSDRPSIAGSYSRHTAAFILFCFSLTHQMPRSQR